MPSGLREQAALLLFVLSYLGIAVGRVPGTALDRTGIALMGAVAMLCTGLLSPAQVADAIDLETLAILGGLMLLSALYDRSGLYDRITGRLATLAHPRLLLVGTVAVAALLAALLTNDVVCVAMTPVIAATCLRRRWPPVPFLIAIAAAANIGSALTPIGNPQNILIAQTARLPFGPFAQAAALPVLLSLGALVALLWRPVALNRTLLTPDFEPTRPRPFHRDERKAIALSMLAILLFLTPIPASLSALVIGALVLFSRTSPSGDLLRRVDFPLLLLFVALFVLVGGFKAAGWSDALARVLAQSGADLSDHGLLIGAAAAMSNLVSNVPAVMLLLPMMPPSADHAITLALGSTLAGNAVLISSVANLIVVAQARNAGIELRFRDHARIGLPLTAISLLITLLCRQAA